MEIDRIRGFVTPPAVMFSTTHLSRRLESRRQCYLKIPWRRNFYAMWNNPFFTVHVTNDVRGCPRLSPRRKMYQTKLKLTARPKRERSPFRPAANSALLIPFAMFPARTMKPRSRRKLVFLSRQGRSVFRTLCFKRKKKGGRGNEGGKKQKRVKRNILGTVII